MGYIFYKMIIVSKLESINGIFELIMIRECEENDSIIDELFVKYEFFDIVVFVYELGIDNGFKSVGDIINKVCVMDIIDVIFD